MLWMRQKSLSLVLIASLAFNAGVGVTYGVRAYRDARPPHDQLSHEQRLDDGETQGPSFGSRDGRGLDGLGPHGRRARGLHDRMLRALELDPEVEKRLRDDRDALFESVHDIRAELALESERLANLVAASEPDRDAIAKQLTVIEGLRTQIQQAVIDHILEVRSVLRPEQLDRFMEMIHHHLVGPARGHGHGPGPMLHGLGRRLKGFLGYVHGAPTEPDPTRDADEGV